MIEIRGQIKPPYPVEDTPTFIDQHTKVYHPHVLLRGSTPASCIMHIHPRGSGVVRRSSRHTKELNIYPSALVKRLSGTFPIPVNLLGCKVLLGFGGVSERNMGKYLRFSWTAEKCLVAGVLVLKQILISIGRRKWNLYGLCPTSQYRQCAEPRQMNIKQETSSESPCSCVGSRFPSKAES